MIHSIISKLNLDLQIFLCNLAGGKNSYSIDVDDILYFRKLYFEKWLSN